MNPEKIAEQFKEDGFKDYNPAGCHFCAEAPAYPYIGYSFKGDFLILMCKRCHSQWQIIFNQLTTFNELQKAVVYKELEVYDVKE